MKDRDEFESVRNKMRSQIDELKDNLRQSTEKIEELEQKQKVQSKFYFSLVNALTNLI